MAELRHLPFTRQPHLTRQYTHPAVKVSDENEGISSVARSEEEHYFYISPILRQQRENSERHESSQLRLRFTGICRHAYSSSTSTAPRLHRPREKNSMCHHADSCVPDEPDARLPDSPHPDSIGSFSDRGRSRQALHELYLLHLFYFILKKKPPAPSTQTTSYPQPPHPRLPAALGTNTNSPPRQMEAAVIEALSSATVLVQKLSNAHTPPPPTLVNEPVRFYHPKGLDTFSPPFFFTTLHILSSACF